MKKQNPVRLKVNPARLPKPILPPTKDHRIGEVVPDKDIWRFCEAFNTSHMVEARRRGIAASVEARRRRNGT